MSSDAAEKLLADVCGTLARAGFDVASVGVERSTGLRDTTESADNECWDG
ncbi:hypothetical protein OOK39_31435 [Streptomyces sp. NBC_00264]|nr:MULTISPECIES: hypothetical protein [unclassified Streptomyces]MCX5163746.1 hypothetical protein [Streptomyces sp. NBC_00305]MCX5222269.1 hypothetical protein [Streptomyces sp. NBC_00264]